MPTVYERKMDGSNSVRYIQHSLIRFYLDEAYKSATKAKKKCQKGVLQGSSIIGIMFSVMAVEAFINEISEDLIEPERLNEFMFLRKTFKKVKGESSIISKLKIIFEIKFSQPLKKELVDDVKLSVEFRNNLVHYKLSELGEIHVMPPIKTVIAEDGSAMSCIDFTVKPERIEPPFISKINGKTAASCFNSVLATINYWGHLMGVNDNVPGLKKIT